VQTARVLRAGLGLSLVTLSLLAASARADERPVAEAIGVAAAPDEACVDGASLASAVRGWLGRDAIAVELEVAVEVGAESTTIHLRRSGASIGARTFDRLPTACADRRAVLALAIALAIDAALLESIGIAPLAAAPAAPTEPPPDPEPAPVEPPRAPAGERVAVSIEAEAVLAIEVLPDVALAGAASVAVLLGGGARLRAGVLATQRSGTPIAHGSAALSLVAGRIDGCYGRVVAAHILLGGCAGVLAGGVLAEGVGFAEVYAPTIPWVAGAVRAELRWLPWDVLALGVSVEGLFVMVRPRLDLGDGEGGTLAARILPPAGVAIALGAALLIE
jgi:hypothetical protein